MVNHVGIYGSKAAEGLSAFQRRSCVFRVTYKNYRPYEDKSDFDDHT